MITSPILRYHGGKFRMASWIMDYFPDHRCYVEPYGGAANVLIQKPPSYSEVYNDLDDELYNFFQVLRDEELRAQLIELSLLTPYSRRDFELAWEESTDSLERARRLLIRSHMGFSSAGATAKTGFRSDTSRDSSTAQHIWARYPDVISQLGSRFSGVLIEHAHACKVMKAHDAPTTLHYVDPPYLHECRVVGASNTSYRHEMTRGDHIEMLECLKDLDGMVVLSGYASDLYDSHLQGWEKHQFQTSASGQRGTVSRTEVLWLNPACVAAQKTQLRLIA
jgi:DNA adenine methylase